MDSTDRALLTALTRNARASVTDLASSLRLARSTVQSRLERLETTGAIAGYTIRLGEPARAQIRATVLLQLTPRTAPAVLSRLKPMPQVERAHSTSGRFDLIVQLACTSTTDLDETLDRVGSFDGIIRSETLIHLATKIDRAV